MNRKLYKNQYRIKTTRLPEWDYGWDGHYFVTLCTQNREPHFGEIINNRIQLNEIGIIVNNLWQKIPNHFNCVQLDEFIVMPNHVHGILIIENGNTPNAPDANVSVETLRATSLQG